MAPGISTFDPIDPAHVRVQALKALWLSDVRMSTCAPLDGKLAALQAAKAGATPIEACYVAQGYTLPEGWTWERIASHRARYCHPAHMVPIICYANTVAWATPIAIGGDYMRHPLNVT